jgi:hypothetical protein
MAARTPRAGASRRKSAAARTKRTRRRTTDAAKSARERAARRGPTVARVSVRRPTAVSPTLRPAAGRLRPHAVGADFAFETVLAERGPTGLWPHLFLPREASRWLGRRGGVNVIVNVEGVTFRRTARPDGRGGHFILFNAEMRERSGVEPGDRVRVGLEVDHAPRGVEAPRELDEALKSDPHASAAWKSMRPSHRRAYVGFIEEAKRPETKVRRVQQALRMMAQWAEERARRPARKKR